MYVSKFYAATKYSRIGKSVGAQKNVFFSLGSCYFFFFLRSLFLLATEKYSIMILNWVMVLDTFSIFENMYEITASHISKIKIQIHDEIFFRFFFFYSLVVVVLRHRKQQTTAKLFLGSTGLENNVVALWQTCFELRTARDSFFSFTSRMCLLSYAEAMWIFGGAFFHSLFSFQRS